MVGTGRDYVSLGAKRLTKWLSVMGRVSPRRGPQILKYGISE